MKRLCEKCISQGEKNLKGLHGAATRSSLKVRNSLEKRAAQIHAKKIEEHRQDDREQLRKECKQQQTREQVRKLQEKLKLTGDARQESEVDWAMPSSFPSRMAKKEGLGQSHPNPA